MCRGALDGSLPLPRGLDTIPKREFGRIAGGGGGARATGLGVSERASATFLLSGARSALPSRCHRTRRYQASRLQRPGIHAGLPRMRAPKRTVGLRLAFTCAGPSVPALAPRMHGGRPAVCSRGTVRARCPLP